MSCLRKKAGIVFEKDDNTTDTYNTTEHLLQKLCDKEDYSNMINTFIIVRNCGHSFHTGCLPSGDVAF